MCAWCVCLFAICRYIPSANECPLRLQLPNGEISVTNGFISPVLHHYLYFLNLDTDFIINLSHNSYLQTWGGVVVLNPPNCWENENSIHPLRRKVSPQVINRIIYIQ